MKILTRPLLAVGSTNFGGDTWDLSIVDEIAAPDMLLKLIRFSGRACILYLGDEGPFRFNSFE